MYFEIDRHKQADSTRSRAQGEYYFVVKSDNHVTIVVTEGYKSKQSCLEAVELIRGMDENTPIHDKTDTSPINKIFSGGISQAASRNSLSPIAQEIVSAGVLRLDTGISQTNSLAKPVTAAGLLSRFNKK